MGQLCNLRARVARNSSRKLVSMGEAESNARNTHLQANVLECLEAGFHLAAMSCKCCRINCHADCRRHGMQRNVLPSRACCGAFINFLK